MPKVFNAREVVRERNFEQKNNASSISTSVDANAVGHGVYAKPLTSLAPQLSASMLTYVYRFLKLAIMVLGAIFMSSHAYAQTVIYQDDFEAGASGWSNNTTENAMMLGTDFLGPFGLPNPETMRTFTVPAGATSLEIEFDLLRFDSWDFFNDPTANDGFAVEINGTSLFSSSNGQGTFDVLSFGGGQGARSGTTGSVDWAHVPINPAAGSAPANLDFRNLGSFDFDQIHRFTLTVNNPGPSVTLTLRADLDQGLGDESAGYDNFLVTAIVPTPSLPTSSGSKTPFPTGPMCFTDQYSLTGSDQVWTVPAGTNLMKIKAWGAAGANNNNPFGRAGFATGAGGYAEGDFTVGAGQLIAPGDSLAIMVGDSRPNSGLLSYGFGGSAVSAGSGGGLSGVFLGSAAITQTDQARAIVIAGGGGGNDDFPPQAANLHQTGGPGGDPATAGGNVGSLAGVLGSTAGAGMHSGGAGGGYEGGILHKFDAPTSTCLLYTSPSPRDATLSRMPSSA